MVNTFLVELAEEFSESSVLLILDRAVYHVAKSLLCTGLNQLPDDHPARLCLCDDTSAVNQDRW